MSSGNLKYFSIVVRSPSKSTHFCVCRHSRHVFVDVKSLELGITKLMNQTKLKIRSSQFILRLKSQVTFRLCLIRLSILRKRLPADSTLRLNRNYVINTLNLNIHFFFSALFLYFKKWHVFLFLQYFRYLSFTLWRNKKRPIGYLFLLDRL